VEIVGKQDWSTEAESYLTQQRGSVLAAMFSLPVNLAET
jgi:hypothetical protein